MKQKEKKKRKDERKVLTLTGLLMEGVSGLLNHASLERLAYPDYSTFITERGISVFVLRVFYQNNVT
jgi:hypothetical protein